MGTKGRELVGEHADKIFELLNKALCDEWLAYRGLSQDPGNQQ